MTFSEAVEVAEGWFAINCTNSGEHSATVSGGNTVFQLNPVTDFAPTETCTVSILAALITDSDTDDPPDEMTADYQWDFTAAAAPVAGHMIINEVDSDTPGSDTAEFIELSSGGTGQTALDGLVVVLYNGTDDRSYKAIDLDGQRTATSGYFVLGNTAVADADLIIPNSTLQNGADAVALYAGSAAEFPNGTMVTDNNLLDALVYDTDDVDDNDLLTLVLQGEPQVNESSRNNPAGDSNQRCPDSSGGQRRTSSYLQNLPTPGANNKCTYDSPPEVSSVTPQDGESNVPTNSSIMITFSEPVTVADGWFEFDCTIGGPRSAAVSGSSTTYTLAPDEVLAYDDICTVMIMASKVSDDDGDDPPDVMAVDYIWSFSTASAVIAEHMVINEVDADTPGSDRAEFIELYDGGGGNTSLDGLVIVFYNGSNDLSYRSFDLDGLNTNSEGYFVLGNEEVPGVDLLFGNALLQNGPDAVALYAGNGQDFANGTAVTTNNLLDALVYDTADADDDGLLVLLQDGQPQVDEAGRGDNEGHSNQRCPNGQGGQRISSGYLQNPPTPGTTNDCTADLPPQVTETWPLNGAVGIASDANITISFSEAVTAIEPWISLSCDRSGDHAVQVSGGPINFTVDPEIDFGVQEVCIATISAQQITDLDGLPDALAADYSWSFSTGTPSFGACGDPSTPIHLIQGNGVSTPLSGTQGIIIEGIVTGDFQGQERLNGFFIQQKPETIDNDPLTSEGIFIYDNDFGINVNVSEIVRLQGDVLEIDSLTSIGHIIDLAHCGTAQPPAPKPLTLPVADTAVWENVEGMLVHISQTLAATGHEALGSEGAVDLALNGRLYYPTEIADPGEGALVVADLNNRSRITLDDGSQLNNPLPLPPYLGISNTLRVGDTLDGLTGILSENSSGYRIQPAETVSFRREEHRPPAPPEPGDKLRLVSFDAGDYFNGDGLGGGFPGERGAKTAEEFARQRTKIINAISALQADVVALSGIENDGYGEYSALQNLVNGLNEEAGDMPYTLIDPGLPHLGETATAVALIYRSARVLPLGPTVTINTTPFDAPNSQPLVQAFAATGNDETIVVAATQFHGRETCPPEEDSNADQGDGQGCYALLRKQSATALASWLETDPIGSSEDDILILGNLNAYSQEDPLAELLGVGYTNLAMTLASGNGYTSVVGGETGTLNHGLASPSLAGQVHQIIQWHINAAEPQALDYREGNQPGLYDPSPYRSTVQDPLLIDLDLALVETTPNKLFFPITLGN